MITSFRTVNPPKQHVVCFLCWNAFILMVASGSAISPTALNEIPDSTWKDVTDSLLWIHAAAQAGRTEEATRSLQSAASFWVEPFDGIAQEALDRFRDDPTTEAPGVLELLAEINCLDDRLLREDLENKIFNAEPPIQKAIEAIRLTRANSAFNEGHTESALAEFRKLLRDFPASESTGTYQFNIAIALRDLERYHEAISEFERLFYLPVDNREMEGRSIMEMGYRNYHHRAAVNIAWCHEQVGDLDSAAHWIGLASTEYPYEGWCNVEIDGARRYLEKAADRIAFAQGTKQGALRILVVASRAWPAWTLFLGWSVLSGIAARRSRKSITRAICASVPVSLAASTSMVFLGLRDNWGLIDWILPGYFPGILILVGGVFTTGTITAGVFWKTGKPRVASRSLAVTCLVTSVLLFHSLWQAGIFPPHSAQYSLNDLQVLAFSYYATPTAIFASGAALILRVRHPDRPG